MDADGWHVVDDGEDRTEWERRDRSVRVVVRRTATGGWAATLDALKLAPEGPAYERETHSTREAATDRARTWRERYAPG